MHCSVRWVILLPVLAGCRDTRPESARPGMPDAAAGNRGAAIQDVGLEFEAPRLIPGVRAQISEIEDPETASERNLTAFKNGVGALVTAMKADLNRVGVKGGGYFYALSDSVLLEIGGGADDLPDQVERLIGIYEAGMRKAAN